MNPTWSDGWFWNLGIQSTTQISVIRQALALDLLSEREACAKIANTISDKARAIYKGRASEDGQFRRGDPWADGYSDGAGDVAEQILARGGK